MEYLLETSASFATHIRHNTKYCVLLLPCRSSGVILPVGQFKLSKKISSAPLYDNLGELGVACSKLLLLLLLWPQEVQSVLLV